MTKPTLVVLAAGMGSRFGGNKQITPVDEAGHFILDFSLFDALRAGFRRVVMVINGDHESEYRRLFDSRFGGELELVYASQRLDNLPRGFAVPQGRVKPWGTAHAVLSAKPYMDGPFAVINADDYYGPQGFRALYDFLVSDGRQDGHAMVAYPIENTLTEHGQVSRGVCRVADGRLVDITERTGIEPEAGGAAFTLDGRRHHLTAGTPVSMNFWGFDLKMMAAIEAGFTGFLEARLAEDPLKCEYYLPAAVARQIEAGTATVQVLTTGDRWHGVTYSDDLPAVVEAVARLKAQGLYPERLWGPSHG